MSSTDLLVVLDPKHKKFADNYLATNRKKESAIVAGYSPKSAHTEASRLLKRPDIQQYIATAAAKQLSDQQDIEAEARETIDTRIIEEMKALAFANITDFISIDKDGLPQVDFSTATPEQLRAITSIKTKTSRRFDGKGAHIATDVESSFTMADKLRGLELLGKHRGLFKTEEQRVVVDVADRLLNARSRLARANLLGDSEISLSGGRGG